MHPPMLRIQTTCSAPFILFGGRCWSPPPLKLHCKKKLAIFPSPAGMSLTKLSLGGKNFIIPAQEEFGK
jgi:hypothetical protein